MLSTRRRTSIRKGEGRPCEPRSRSNWLDRFDVVELVAAGSSALWWDVVAERSWLAVALPKICSFVRLSATPAKQTKEPKEPKTAGAAQLTPTRASNRGQSDPALAAWARSVAHPVRRLLWGTAEECEPFDPSFPDLNIHSSRTLPSKISTESAYPTYKCKMSVASVKYLFTPELLDGRLVSDISTTPQSNGVSKRDEIAPDPAGKSSRRTSASRWQTIEYFLYYAVFIIVIPMMFHAVYQISKEDHPNYLRYSSILSDGWLFGRKVDNTDMQYKGFRDNVPILFIVLAAHTALRKLTSRTLGNADINTRAPFDNIFAIVFLIVLHGISYFKILALLSINYAILKALGPSKATPAAIWVFNVVIMCLNEWKRGYLFGRILGPEYAWIDSQFGGMMPRWEVHFNITMLRVISFSMDYYWALTTGPDLERRKKPAAAHQSDKDRVSTSHSLSLYNFSLYHAYCLYSPLYMAGPIITYNDFLAQNLYSTKQPLPSTSFKPVFLYAVRFFLSLLCMEFVLHFCYVQAISKASHAPYNAWINDTPFQLMMIGYFNLHIIWLKLLIPWRFFRLWSLVDSIDPPENMLRCMSDNYSAVGFWRGWHRSYNRWNIRYIYIPLGGSKSRPILNMLLVFTFVALWHDLSMKLLTWGWLIVLFILPELTARGLLPYSRYGGNWWYRPLAAVGGTLTVLTMCVANLIGFALGVDGVNQLIYDGILNAGWAGALFLGGTLGCLFVGINIMFEIREEEGRRGLFLGC